MVLEVWEIWMYFFHFHDKVNSSKRAEKRTTCAVRTNGNPKPTNLRFKQLIK